MTKKDAAKLLKLWLESGGNPSKLAASLNYKHSTSVYNWVRRGVPERVIDLVLTYIARGKQ